MITYVISGTLKKMRRERKDHTTSYPPISEGDLKKLYSSGVLTPATPIGLQRLVFFSLQYFFCRRGREGNRDLKKDSFVVERDDVGAEYIGMSHNEHQKNHPGNLNEDYNTRKRLYAVGGPMCPVRAFKTYITKLHPACECLYQRPTRVERYTDRQWYDNAPVGHNTLGNMMKEMSSDAVLSRSYTNHSIRATTIVGLNDAGVGDRIICSLSGHRNQSSIQSYCKDASAKQKREMSTILTSRLGSTSTTSMTNSKPHTVSKPPDEQPDRQDQRYRQPPTQAQDQQSRTPRRSLIPVRKSTSAFVKSRPNQTPDQQQHQKTTKVPAAQQYRKPAIQAPDQQSRTPRSLTPAVRQTTTSALVPFRSNQTPDDQQQYSRRTEISDPQYRQPSIQAPDQQSRTPRSVIPARPTTAAASVPSIPFPPQHQPFFSNCTFGEIHYHFGPM